MIEKFKTDKITKQLKNKVRNIWETNAEWWDSKIGDGNVFQNLLIEPYTEKLLDIKKGENVLDIACGVGRFSRRLAELGAYVIAFDFSKSFIKIAKNKSKKIDSIDYYALDATDEKQLLNLGENKYDWAICTMALMDMAEIRPLLQSLNKLLKVNGKFIFSILHPCFNSANIQKFTEEHMNTGRLEIKNGVKIYSYKTPIYYKSEGIVGQPVPQYYFHRTQEEIFNICFENNFAINGFVEPCFKRNDNKDIDITWQTLYEIPPILIVRMILLKK